MDQNIEHYISLLFSLMIMQILRWKYLFTRVHFIFSGPCKSYIWSKGGRSCSWSSCNPDIAAYRWAFQVCSLSCLFSLSMVNIDLAYCRYQIQKIFFQDGILGFSIHAFTFMIASLFFFYEEFITTSITYLVLFTHTYVYMHIHACMHACMHVCIHLL